MNYPQKYTTLVKLPKFQKDETLSKKIRFLEYYLNFIRENNNNLTWSTFGEFTGDILGLNEKTRDFVQEYNRLCKFSEEIELSIVKKNDNYKLMICLMEDDYASILNELIIFPDELESVLNIFAQTNVYNEYLGCCVWS